MHCFAHGPIMETTLAMTLQICRGTTKKKCFACPMFSSKEESSYIKQRGKIKNDKIMHWRIELSCYNLDIVCCPGAENIAPFSRSFCAAVPAGVNITELHNSLCHPGITRMLHFVWTRNLLFSVEEVGRMTKAYRVCAEHKPQFHKPSQAYR